MKGEEGDMLGCVEMVWEEGIKEGRKTIISNMIKKGVSLKEIRELTKATKKEIEEIEKGK